MIFPLFDHPIIIFQSIKDLTSYLNSRYLNAADKLKKAKRKKVVAYVESYDDVFFWRSILSDFENDERYFEVMLPSKTNLNRGKKVAMMNRLGEGLGAYMIACVDADLDYLLMRHTRNSSLMLDNPYVVHTYAYAIENLQCYAPSLHQVCVMATLNDRAIFDFEGYLQAYSEAIYELFVWAIWIYRANRFTEFPLTSLNNIINVERLNVMNYTDAIERVRHNANRKVAYLQKHYPEAKGKLKPLKAELATLGLRPDNTYLYIQGHHLLDNVVSAAIDPVITILRREREKDIKRLANGNIKQMDNELSCYQHSQAPFEAMIRRNTNFKQSEQYELIKRHIQKILDAIAIKETESSGENTAQPLA